MDAREEYLEGRVKKMTEEVAGYKELVRSLEGIMAALVKKGGGEVEVSMEDVKEAIDARKRLMYHYNADKKTYTLMAVEE